MTTYLEIMSKMLNGNTKASIQRITAFMAGIQDCVWENVKEVRLSWELHPVEGAYPNIVVVFKEKR